MSKKDNNCALCGAVPEKEEPAVLALGNYGYARCLCEQCEEEIDIATLGRKYDEIEAAINRLGKKTATFGKDDKITLRAMQDILLEAAKRAQAIKDGTYDFALDEAESTDATDDESFEEIPEELRETEEDRELDEKEAEFNKKFDKVLNWIWVFLLVGIVVFFGLRFFGVI